MEAGDGQLTQLAGLDDLLGPLDEGVVSTVLAHEHGHASGLGLDGERLGVGEVVGNGLLHQGHDTTPYGLAGNAQVQAVGGGDDDAVGRDLVHHGRGVGVERHAGGVGRGAGALEGVGDGAEVNVVQTSYSTVRWGGMCRLLPLFPTPFSIDVLRTSPSPRGAG